MGGAALVITAGLQKVKLKLILSLSFAGIQISLEKLSDLGADRLIERLFRSNPLVKGAFSFF